MSKKDKKQEKSKAKPILRKKYTEKNWFQRNTIELVTIIGGLIIINLFLLAKTYKGNSIDAENAAQFGGFISGYIGTIFGLISVVFLYSTLKNQRETSEIEKFETKFFELIKLHRDNVAEITIKENSGKRVFVTLIREFRETLKITKQVCKDLNITLSKEQEINLAYLAFFYGVGPNSTRVLKNSATVFSDKLIDALAKKLDDEKLKDKIAKARNFAHTPFEGHQSRLGHYFRHLYQTVVYVHEKNLDIDKYGYLKTLRAQLSNHEQALLFFNSLSEIGKKWREEKLIEEYSFIKNIPKSFINETEEIDVKKIYPTLLFEYEE